MLSLRFPMVGLVNYMASYLLAPNQDWWARSVAHLGIRYYMVAAIFLAAGMALNWRSIKVRCRRFTGLEWSLLAFLVTVWLSVPLGIGVAAKGWTLVDKTTKVFIFLLLMTHCASSLDRYKVIRRVWVIAGLYLGYRCFVTDVSGRLTGIGGPDFGGSSGMSAHLAITLSFVGASFLVERKWWARALCLVAGGLVFNGLVLMRTRGAFLGLLVGAVAAVLVMPKRHRTKILVAMLLASILAYGLTDDAFWERMHTISIDTNEMDRSAKTRYELWKTSVDILADYPLGVGVGNFYTIIGDYAPELTGRSSHNTFVRLYVDLGLQGVAVYLLILWLAARSLLRTRRLARENQNLETVEIEAVGLAVAIVTALTAGIFTDRLYVEGYWWLFAMVVCLERSSENAVLLDSNGALAQDPPQAPAT